MICKKLMTRMFLIGPVLGAMLAAGILVGCVDDSGRREGRDSGGAAVSQGESGGEHGGTREGTEGGGGQGSGGEGGTGGGEEGSAANMLAPDETFDMVRSGARLILSYDATANSFNGTVENTTSGTLTRVRVEIHLSNGVELGPTAPVDLAAGGTIDVNLPATPRVFTGWLPHVEVGSAEAGESGGESGAESGSEGSGGGESGPDGPEGAETAGEAAREAAMSSPVTPLGQTWEGNLGGLAVFARYDAVTRSVESTVRNTLSQVVCYVQAEPHLKSGTQTVGELGPDVLGHLSPGQTAVSSVSIASEPNLAGVSVDGYVVHLEVFDCGGTGPVPHTAGQGAEGGGEGAGGEGGVEGSGGESGSEGSGGEEATANQLAPDQTFDMVRNGARLILSYDAASNSFRGTVENTTSNVLIRVRVEVHLSNGAELGPTSPVNLAPGQVAVVDLPSTPASFTGWIAHAEVGSGGEGSQSGGEHGSSGESGGEHGSGGEGSGGG
ncbi:MAG: hypothetical protein OXG22_02995 [Chloroflexi bacterium]|nr:hypothetical protein [Chloroflexota bacterium]